MPKKRMPASDPFLKKKSLGQHFLNSPYVPKRMADAADLKKDEAVVEIGPGTGALTRELLKRGARVITIETDKRAVAVLRETFREELAQDQLTIVEADARSLNLKELGVKEHQYKVVANIPYYLSGMLFRTFLETPLQPSCIVFLVQKEVALRIAREKKESLLSLSVKAYGTPRYIATVSKNHFTPPPKVTSAILLIEHISHARLQDVDEKFFFTLIHHGFKSRRKQLLGNLSSLFPREELTHTFSILGISEKARGEDLDITTWLLLAKALERD